MTPYVLEIDYRDPLDASAALRDAPMTLLLHGAGERGRWSYVAADPVERITVSADGGRDALATARRWLGAVKAKHDPSLPPFSGGVAGLVGYETARAFDVAPCFASPDGTPDLALGLYDCAAAFDHTNRRAFIVAHDVGVGHPQARAARLRESLRPTKTPAPASTTGALAPTEPRAVYEDMVRKLVARIRGGDLFQANVSRRYEGALAQGDHPFALFQRLCKQSPAPFAAYLRLDQHAIVSNSPERFLSVTPHDGALHAFTQPIKGTSPRGASVPDDQANAAALLASEKDRAENLMIVDLMRNDLSRTCAPGSVRVPRLFGLESYTNVHHMVSDVSGVLRHGADAFDLFAHAFPPGSITGAPKVKAMEIIGAYERSGRGPYCGAMVWFGFDGAMDSSVLIRTATCTEDGAGWNVAFNVGAGIVSDSDPREEALETIAKAASLKRAILGHAGEET
ncbi:anthranilate synthase component I family protein [Vitreimonas sp.]|uniref:anthranilate synthase component I family protein n=1 Tax=Vitreimonas sp. TaxID=3069702 RepID=UPI002ED97AD7